MIQLSSLDRLIAQVGTSLNVLALEQRPLERSAGEGTTADVSSDAELGIAERKLSGRLMRVNHAGEIAAQGLYQGQALFSRSETVRAQLQRAAQEESEHLSWCAQRVSELGMPTSRLDSFWYLGSGAMGAMVSLYGDRISLGFIAETERQVVKHLDRHLARLPQDDHKSRRIIERMRNDEEAHGQAATTAGAMPLPFPVPALMHVAAKLMTTTAFWI